MIDYSIAISTYMTINTFKGRFDIFKECISSLLKTNFLGTIFIVDDNSELNNHLEWAYKLEDERIVIHKKTINSGIAKCKNTCIRLLLENKNNNYIFLSDDDMIFLDKNWFENYIHAIKNTSFEHFCFAANTISDNSSEKLVENNINIIKTTKVNGCLLCMTKNIVDKVGYFKVMDYKYGHEHSNFSIRCSNISVNKGFYDLCGSDKWLSLNHKSGDNPSMTIDHDKVRGNLKYLESLEKERCIE